MLSRIAISVCFLFGLASLAQKPKDKSAAASHPWDDVRLSPDARAAMVLAAMTLDEKLAMIHGMKQADVAGAHFDPSGTVEGAGYLPGVPRLGIPSVDMTDSAVGARVAANGSRYATLLTQTGINLPGLGTLLSTAQPVVLVGDYAEVIVTTPGTSPQSSSVVLVRDGGGIWRVDSW